MILVLTNRGDLTADLGILAFRRAGLPYVRLNTEECIPDLYLWGDGQIRVTLAGRPIDISRVSVVWLRRPVYFRSYDDVPARARRFVASEATATWLNFYQLFLSSVPWVNHPEASRRAERRAWVLDLARRYNLLTPPTLVTARVEAARAFLKAVGPIVAKSVGPGFRDDRLGVASFTTLIERVENLPADLGPAPVLFQAYIAKVSDWRVTVFGRRMYAVRIDSQRESSARIDWRRSTRPLRIEPAALPVSVQSSLLDLLSHLGLSFAAIDLAEDTDGNLWFLEVNPNGQWGWIEQEIGLPLSDGLAELLRGYLRE